MTETKKRIVIVDDSTSYCDLWSNFLGERYADIAVALGVGPTGSVLATAEAGLMRLTELSRACGVPQRLRDVKIPEADLPRLAREAIKIQRLLKNNPREITEPDALAIYRAAY